MKLNLGAGGRALPGYLNLDRIPAPGVHVGEAYPLDFPDACADEVRASHLLEHFPDCEAQSVIQDWARVLRPGCILKIAVPDFDKIREQPHGWDRFLMGAGANPNDIHRSAWDRAKLACALERAGLIVAPEPWSDVSDASSLPVSLNVQARKPIPAGAQGMGGAVAAPREDEITICGVMSLPRLGWNDAWGCIVDALQPFHIPVRRFTGAFWDQCFQSVLEACVESGTDWALCFDYDSMVTTAMLNRMFGLFGSRPDMDALAAMQPRRYTEMPLLTAGAPGAMKTSMQIDGSPIRCRTAHFGCTLLRLDRLKDLPKPWVWGQPASNGTWSGDDKIDPDMYFWKLWEAQGRTLYVDPNVRIGHLEVMVSEFDERLQHRWVHPRDWIKRQKQK